MLKKAEKEMSKGRYERADGRFSWAIVGRNDDWDMHAYLGRFAAHLGMSHQDRAHGATTQADEHEAPAKRYLEAAYAIDPDHAREMLERMMNIDLASVLEGGDDPAASGSSDPDEDAEGEV
jgi:hypothetical protein